MDDLKMKQAYRNLALQYSDYHPNVYRFVSEAVSFAVGRTAADGSRRHVSGAELTDGVLQYATSQYAVFAPLVLEYWNLITDRDLGIIVFRMIDAKLLSASENDKPEDFHNGINLPGCLRAAIHKLQASIPSCPDNIQPIA